MILKLNDTERSTGILTDAIDLQRPAAAEFLGQGYFVGHLLDEEPDWIISCLLSDISLAAVQSQFYSRKNGSTQTAVLRADSALPVRRV